MMCVCWVMLMETDGITSGYVNYWEKIASFFPQGYFILWKSNNLLDMLNIYISPECWPYVLGLTFSIVACTLIFQDFQHHNEWMVTSRSRREDNSFHRKSKQNKESISDEVCELSRETGTLFLVTQIDVEFCKKKKVFFLFSSNATNLKCTGVEAVLLHMKHPRNKI